MFVALCIVMVMGFLVSIKVLLNHKDIVKLGGREGLILCVFVVHIRSS